MCYNIKYNKLRGDDYKMELKDIVFSKRLSNFAKVTYFYLFFSMDENCECSTTFKELGEALKMSHCTMRKYLKELKDNSLVYTKKIFVEKQLDRCVFVLNGVKNDQPQKGIEEPKMDDSEKKIDEKAQKIQENLGNYTSEQQGKILEILKYLESN